MDNKFFDGERQRIDTQRELSSPREALERALKRINDLERRLEQVEMRPPITIISEEPVTFPRPSPWRTYPTCPVWGGFGPITTGTINAGSVKLLKSP